MTVTNAGKVAKRTIGLALECGRFGDRRKGNLDAVTVDADKGLLGLTKHLVPRTRGRKADVPEAAQRAAKALRAVARHDLLAQEYLRLTVGLPSFFKPGTHRIPLALVDEVEKRLQDMADARKPLVAEFIDSYPELIEAMRGPLGSQYRAADFPAVEEVSASFRFGWRWFALDDVPEGIRDFSLVAWNAAQEKIAANMQAVADGVEMALRGYLREIVTTITAKLAGAEDGEPKKFRQSSILNELTDFLRTFELRNVTDDAELAALVDELKIATGGLDLDAVKTDARMQVTLKASLDSVGTALDGLLIGRGVRAIELPDEDEVPA